MHYSNKALYIDDARARYLMSRKIGCSREVIYGEYHVSPEIGDLPPGPQGG